MIGGTIMSIKKKETKKDHILFTFLEQTKSGKYAKIEEHSLEYPRLEIQREDYYCEEQYYYSIR